MNTMTPTATMYAVIVTGPAGPDVDGIYQNEVDARRAVSRISPTLRPIVLPTPYYPTQAGR